MQPLNVVGSCVMNDEVLFTHMDSAILRGLPEVKEQNAAREGVIVLVGSGPSVDGQLEILREMKAKGTPIVGIKDAHDWLIKNGIVPDYALAIDPQEERSHIFTPHELVHYMIASQCHAAMFDRLAGYQVTVWHPYITKGQKRPPDRIVIGGGTTSGLRAISLFYVLGWRHFALFGFDSCLREGKLRVNGDGPKDGHQLVEVRPGNGKTYVCNASMALQAQDFQTYYDYLPDVNFYAFGDGLIQDIIRQRDEQLAALHAIYGDKPMKNGRVSFIHGGGPDMASYRYRAAIPAREIGASLNDLSADTLIFAKPSPQDLWEMGKAKARGATVIVDFCDPHFDWMHYREALRLADFVTCPTETMMAVIREQDAEKTIHIIPDPYEYPEAKPHCQGVNLLWFGHAVNKHSLERVLPEITDYPLLVVSNFAGAVPWSKETMNQAFANADIVILPKTEDYKSPNRAIESIRQGCFVVAEPQPSLKDFPIWQGNIKEGIEWARQNPDLANQQTSKAQKYVMERYSPPTLASAWKKFIPSLTTSDAEKFTGTDG